MYRIPIASTNVSTYNYATTPKDDKITKEKYYNENSNPILFHRVKFDVSTIISMFFPNHKPTPRCGILP